MSFPKFLRQRRLLHLVLPVLAWMVMPGIALARSQQVTFDGSVAVVEGPQQSYSVRRATDDLLGDLAKVFGRTPRRVQRLEDSGSVAVLIVEGVKVPAGVHCATTQSTEAFAFSVTSAKSGGATKQVICLTGADARGTIYAIY